ncbi:MAG: hypothetical protein HPY85_01030 [Anaerolineae bacterium]|jgi:hypothetical protein|nr:hypothetical protein [Anaerolineae bacterium]
MEKSKKQAYKQKPWRSQVKWISQVLMAALFLLLASLIYLELAGEATNVSQQMIALQQAKIELQEKIASQQSELARYRSTQSMKPRMEAMGFKRYTYEKVVYVMVPGYQPNFDIQLAPAASQQAIDRPIIRSAYTESLWDWLNEHLSSINLPGVLQ